jgi:hypothetical protein
MEGINSAKDDIAQVFNALGEVYEVVPQHFKTITADTHQLDDT